jgi:predicted phosphodiesterase
MSLLKELGISKVQLKRIVEGKKYKPKIIKQHLTDTELEFGVVSDTHLCSTKECLNELHTFYAILKKMGVEMVLHAGDILSATNVYRGQENEIHTFGFKRQSEYVIKYYPKIEGIKSYYILGNHDLVYWKACGVDVGETISAKREDMIYLGQDKADLTIGKVKIKLFHPGGGTAYADSYHLQKTINSLESGNKPHILIMGHYHRSLYLNDRNVNGLLAGTFEGQTTFQLRKNINPRIGGWTIKVRLDKRGDLVSFQPSWIPFF